MIVFEIFVDLKSNGVTLYGHYRLAEYLSIKQVLGKYKDLNDEQLIYFLMGLMVENQWIAEYNDNGSGLFFTKQDPYFLIKAGDTFESDYMVDVGRHGGFNQFEILGKAKDEFIKKNPLYQINYVGVDNKNTHLFISKISKLLLGPK